MRGFFTQGVCLLTGGQTTIADLRAALEDHGLPVVAEHAPAEIWQHSGPSLLVAFRPEVNGYVSVDVVNQAWPDQMGDPKLDSDTFSAWSMGYFGPYAFPGGLTRAQQHKWTWEPAGTVALGHRGLVRVRMSYVFGASRDAPICPPDADPLAELTCVTRVVQALFKAPGVLCYFNPNGEVLRDRASFQEMWEASGGPTDAAAADGWAPPLPLWMNIRFHRLRDQLFFMDTVGNAQLQVRDVEAFFLTQDHDPAAVDRHLRNVTEYLRSGPELHTGESIDGPGDGDLSWTLELIDQSLLPAPRPVLRIYPQGIADEVRQVLVDMGRTSA